MRSALRRVDEFLLRAERRIALLERCRALNAESEQARLTAAWQNGHELGPTFEYATPPDLSALRAELVELSQLVRELGPVGELYAERALELELEAALVEQVGTPRFRELSRQRYPVKRSVDEASLSARLSAPRPHDGPRFPSDDSTVPYSLLSLIRQHAREAGLALRVVVREELTSLAALADGTIAVRAGAKLSVPLARAIAVHEVYGHAVPHERATQQSLGLYRVGSRWGGDSEEGRALALERRLVGPVEERERSLAERHLAALAVADGASFEDVMRLLLSFASDVSAAVGLACRVLRGGGLGREVVYLQSLQEIEAARVADPGLDDWLGRGRISVQAARQLRAMEAESGSLPKLDDDRSVVGGLGF